MKKMYDNTFSKLNKWFENNKVLTIVAFSGGVDSSVVAFAARKALGNNAIDYNSELQYVI